jgi:type III pantothenate kinase
MSPTLTKELREKSFTLAVDVGNTHTVVGLFDGEQVVEGWRMTTRYITTSDEAFIRLTGLLMRSEITPQTITHAGLCSVVPDLDRVWSKAISKMVQFAPQIVSSENCLNTPIRYDHAASLGSDRICNIIALKDMGYECAVALDLGTATTLDILKDGGFHGGVILPGLTASLDALTQNAAQLLSVTLTWTEKVIATNTADAMRAGILRGFIGELEYFIRAIQEELGVESLPVIATGGWSAALSNRTEIFRHFEPHLALRGIRLIALSSDQKPLQL